MPKMAGMAKLVRLEALPLYASFARLFGGIEKVPPSLLAPAAHFRRIPRSGQHSTLVIAESDDGAVGVGEAFGLPWAGASAGLVDAVCAPALVGQTLEEPAAMLQPLREYLTAMGHSRGPAMEALAASISRCGISRRDAPASRWRPCSAGARAPCRPMSARCRSCRRRRNRGGGARLRRRGLLRHQAQGRARRRDRHRRMSRRCARRSARTASSGSTSTAATTSRRRSSSRARSSRYDIAWLEEPIRPDDPPRSPRSAAAAPMPIAAGENEFVPAHVRAPSRGRRRRHAAAKHHARRRRLRHAGDRRDLRASTSVGWRRTASAPRSRLAGGVHACRAVPSFLIYEANRLLNPLRDDCS